jgi:hypothetical protein
MNYSLKLEHLAISTNMAFEPTFHPVGLTPEARKEQFHKGCLTGANKTEDFWQALHILGFDEDFLGAPIHQLMGNHAAPAACLAPKKDRSKFHRVFGSIQTVRNRWGHDFWHQLNALGISIPTIPAVTLAASLSKLAKANTLHDAGRGLQHALKSNRPGPAVTRLLLGVRCVQNGDVVCAIEWLKSHPPGPDAEEGGGEEQERDMEQARKKRRISAPSPERPRRYSDHQQTQTRNTQSPLLANEDTETFQSSPISPFARVDINSDAINPCLLSPTTLRNSFPLDLHGTRANNLAPRSSESYNSTPRPPCAQTPMADKHRLILNTYEEVKKELEHAHTAAQVAHKAVKRAEKKLARVQKQIGERIDRLDEIHVPLPVLSRTEASQKISMELLNGKIQLLEKKKLLVEEGLNQYSTLLAQMEPVLNVLGKTLPDPEGFYRASAEKLEEPLNDLRALRKEYQEAEAECQTLQQYHDSKKHQYESLKASWDKMWARLKDWGPDDESASESEQA